MIGEFKIMESSKIIGRMTDEVCKKFDVRYIHMHKGLPTDESLRLPNPPAQKIKLGYYLKVAGDYDKVIDLMEIASGD